MSGARAVDLLERDVDAPGVEVTDEAVELALRPFQLVTLRLLSRDDGGTIGIERTPL